jgi:integrase
VVRDDRWSTPTYSLRFTALGRRHAVRLGCEPEWTPARAEEALRDTMALVRSGKWQPPKPVEAPREVPTFHVFASEWYADRETQKLRPKTIEHLRWVLTDNLLPAFAALPLDRITAEAIDGYARTKLREGRLSAASINRTVGVLAAILDDGLEYGLIDRNPARSRRRRLTAAKPLRSWLDSAEQIDALLEAAGRLDERERETEAKRALANRRTLHRRAILAVLVFGGLRIGEVTALRWRDVDTGSGWLTVGESKTDAGRRRVRVRGRLRDELLQVRPVGVDPDRYVFATSSGRKQSTDNLRRSVVVAAAKLASETLVARDRPPLPEVTLPDGKVRRISPHGLRRTFASVLYALGEDPGVVMDEMGHTNPGLALAIYRQSMRRDENERAALRALVDGEDWTAFRLSSGREAEQTPTSNLSAIGAEGSETPQ